VNHRIALPIVLAVACSGPPAADPAPEPTPGDPSPPALESSEPAPIDESTPADSSPADPSPTPATAASKEAVAATIFPAAALEGWSVRLAYDLGSLQIAVIDSPKSPQRLSIVRARPPAAAPVEEFERAFAGEDFAEATHPLELLGYDLVQVRKHGDLDTPHGPVPWVRFGWLKQGDSELDKGSGSAHWLKCRGDVVLVSGEGPFETYTREAAAAFASSPHACAD